MVDLCLLLLQNGVKVQISIAPKEEKKVTHTPVSYNIYMYALQCIHALENLILWRRKQMQWRDQRNSRW